MTANELRDIVNSSDDQCAKLLMRALDCWMDDYIRDEDWLIGIDERDNMAHDVNVFKSELARIFESRS